MSMSRREAIKLAGEGMLSFCLASFLLRTATANDRGMEELSDWLTRFHGLGERLGAATITQGAWQTEMDDVYARAPLEALRKLVDFDRLSSQLKGADDRGRGEIFHTMFVGRHPVEKVVGQEPARVLITKVAHVRKGRSIPPHGHSNMTSAFLHLSGEFRVRQFDKLANEDGKSLVVRPSGDFIGGAGRWSSISDVRNNVHWLTAASEDCFLFTTKMIRLEEGKPFHGRINIDVIRAKQAGNGVLLAPVIDAAQAAELYMS